MLVDHQLDISILSKWFVSKFLMPTLAIFNWLWISLFETTKSYVVFMQTHIINVSEVMISPLIFLLPSTISCQVYATIRKRKICVVWFKFHSWWRHQMETFPALLAIYAGNSLVAGEFPTQRPVTRSFDVFFDPRLNKRLSKQSWGWWFETPSRPLWRHRNVECNPKCPLDEKSALTSQGQTITRINDDSVKWRIYATLRASTNEKCDTVPYTNFVDKD